MERKSTPPAVVISIIVLGLTVLVSVPAFSAVLGMSRGGLDVAVPYGLIGSALIFSVVPIVAIRDMLRGYSSGRYLAILSLLCLWALFLRQFSIFLTVSSIVLRQGSPETTLILLGIVIALPVLILFLGFNKKVAAYFSESLV